jgi:hypothetical protein
MNIGTVKRVPSVDALLRQTSRQTRLEGSLAPGVVAQACRDIICLERITQGLRGKGTSVHKVRNVSALKQDVYERLAA